jgi:disulfide bond formation protein DsbB
MIAFRFRFVAIAMLFLALYPAILSAQSATTAVIPTQLPGHNALLIGADWYPEQWPEARWRRICK